MFKKAVLSNLSPPHSHIICLWDRNADRSICRCVCMSGLVLNTIQFSKHEETYSRNFEGSYCDCTTPSTSKKTGNVYYKSDMDVRSRNHYCHVKAIIITYSESVFCTLSYPGCKAHAPYYMSSVACRVYRIFLHYLVKGKIFGKKLLNIKCVFWFSP